MVCCCIWAIDCFCCCCPSTLPTVRLSSSCLSIETSPSWPVCETVSECKKAKRQTNEHATMKYSFTTPGTLTGSGEGQEGPPCPHFPFSLSLSCYRNIIYASSNGENEVYLTVCAFDQIVATKLQQQKCPISTVAAAQAGQTCLCFSSSLTRQWVVVVSELTFFSSPLSF